MERIGLWGVASPAEIVWSHATNSRKQLSEVLTGGREHMIEADILMGTLCEEKGRVVPIMAHPPHTESDLDFESFLRIVAEHNRSNPERKKLGIKLDFKDPAAVPLCLESLKGKECDFPTVWLNADIWQGPGGGPSKFHAAEFLQDCGKVCCGLTWALSVGWTTGGHAGGPQHPYGADHVETALESLAAVPKGSDAYGVTFPISAYHAFLGRAQIQRLLDAHPRFTLTVWGEVPNPQCEEWLEEMKATGRCYVDTKPPGKIALSLQARNPLWVHVLGVTMVVAAGLMLAHRLRR